MAKPKKRRKWKRPSVDRSERTAATPETLEKLRPCSLKAMSERWALNPRDECGLDPDQLEAASAIWEAHRALSGKLEAKGSHYEERTDPAHNPGTDGWAHRVSIYLDWSREIMRRYWLMPGTVIGWIEDRDPSSWMVNDVQRRLLVRACQLWLELADYVRRARKVDKLAEMAL
jgi:hypothetical protein